MTQVESPTFEVKAILSRVRPISGHHSKFALVLLEHEQALSNSGLIFTQCEGLHLFPVAGRVLLFRWRPFRDSSGLVS